MCLLDVMSRGFPQIRFVCFSFLHHHVIMHQSPCIFFKIKNKINIIFAKPILNLIYFFSPFLFLLVYFSLFQFLTWKILKILNSVDQFWPNSPSLFPFTHRSGPSPTAAQHLLLSTVIFFPVQRGARTWHEHHHRLLSASSPLSFLTCPAASLQP